MAVLAFALCTIEITPAAAQSSAAAQTPGQAPAAAPAAAPDANGPATDKNGGQIVVTGYRASLQSAINTKRRSNNIVDVIKADDMASFPDANLAESIQRIPGVSIQRDAGEGRNITVRGLGGDFVRTTLNGIEAFSTTTGSTLGVVAGLNRTRGFDFSTFASELFNSVTVSKSQSAEMDEGSLAASVDLQTGRPFDKPGFRGAVSVQGAYYDINKKAEPRIAGLISDTFGDFGILVSGAYSTRHAVEDGYSDTSQSDYSDALNGFCGLAVDDPNEPGSQVINTPIPYVNPLSGSGNRPANQCFSGKPSDPTAYAAINKPNVFLPRNPGLGRFTLDQKRLGLTGAIQWFPSDATHVTLDAVYSRFDQNRLDYALSLASNNRNVNGASAQFPLFAGRVDSQIMDVHVDPNGQVDYMKLNNVDIKHIEEASKTRTTTHEVDLVWDQKITDRIGFTGRLGHAGSKFNQPWDVLMSYDAFNVDNYVWDARNDVRRPFISYGYDVTDPANVTFTNAGTGLTPDIRITEATENNTLKTAAGTFHFSFSDALTLKLGGMYKDFDWNTTQQQRLFPNNGPPCTVSSTNTTAVKGSPPAACTGYQTFNFAQFAQDFPGSAPLSSQLTNWGSSLGLPAGSVTGWVVPDVQAYIDKVGILCNCANKYGDFTLSYKAALGSNRSVQEKDLAFFAQMDFNFDIGGHGLRGNFGIRHVRTDMESAGYVSATTLLQARHKYNNWLPSLNAAFDINDDLIARFAAAKVMARPSFAAVTPGGSVTVSNVGGQESASIGNPFLKPYQAKNFNLDLEWYPQKGALYSVGLFYTKVDTMIQNLFSLEPYGDTGLPLSLLPAGQDASTLFNVTRTRNTSGGYIEGIELNAQQSFTFLPGLLRYVGVAANYTHVKSSVLYFLDAAHPTLTTHDQFINVSPNSVNATLFYDDGRFSTHISLAYRDAYLTALPFKASLPDGNYSYPTTNVDASAQYKLNDHLKFTFDALNITNQASDQYSGKIRKAQRVYSLTGRQFFLGAAYSF